MFSINNLQTSTLKSTKSTSAANQRATSSLSARIMTTNNGKKSTAASKIANLTLEEEEKIIKDFVNIVNEIRAHQTSKNGSLSHPISMQNARKFLSARKFELQRTLALYKAHEMIRLREGLVHFDLNSKSLRNELFSEKFTVLPNRDPVSGCCITLFSAFKHDPLDSSHQITLQNIVLQLDVCISSVETQNNGIIFIYNMNNSFYKNFDYELSQKILVLLKGAYPAKLKKVLIVTPPLWFKTSFKILRLFVREKLRDRVYLINQSQLKKHLPKDCLPIELGGELRVDHEKWINHCLEQIKSNHLENNLDSLENVNDLNKSFIINCDLIGENVSSFETESDELDDFHTNSSELNLSGLSEQISGLCDNFISKNLGIKSEEEKIEKLVDLDSELIEELTDKSDRNLKNGNTDIKNEDNKTNNNEPIVIKPALSNRTSLTIIKPKPENIPICKINSKHKKAKSSLIKTNSNGFNNDLKAEDDHLKLFKNYLINNDKSLHLSTDPGCMNLNEFIQHLRTVGRKGLIEEYSQLRYMKDLNFIFNNHENIRRFSKLRSSLNGICSKKENLSKENLKENSIDDLKLHKKDDSKLDEKDNELEDKKDDTNEKVADIKELQLDDLDSRLSDKFNDLMGVFSFENSLQKDNLTKNRYTDVLCYDHTRVQLKLKDEEDFDDIIEEEPANPITDYINANYVDGYEQKKAFISTQGPLNSTCLDFWQMIIQNEVKVIVMTTRTMEGNRIKCSQYWPLQEKSQLNFSYLTIINNEMKDHQDYTISKLTIKDNSTKKEYNLSHLQFLSWPDYGVPHSACAMLDFRNKVREELKLGMEAVNWPEDKPAPPIVVHCSAGIGRTGTFITLDISILRLEDTGLINIQSTVEKIRSQRANSIQMPDQYIFCYLALLEYAIINNMLENVSLDGFEDSDSDYFDD